MPFVLSWAPAAPTPQQQNQLPPFGWGLFRLSRPEHQRGASSKDAIALVVGLAAITSAGCFGNERTTFPPGLEPLEENMAVLPAPVDGDEHPETIVYAKGETDNYSWAHGRGYIHASLGRTWEAFRDIEVVVDDPSVDTWSTTNDVEEGYDFSFRIRNVVHDVVTVEFDITWRESAVGGSVQDPEVVGIAYQKTWGTEFIDLLRGTIVLRPVSDDVTEVDMVEHLDGYGRDAETVVDYFDDVYSDAVAHVHSE